MESNNKLFLIVALFLLILLIGCQPSEPCSNMNTEVEKDECLLELGKNNLDVEICNRIQNKFFKHECQTEIAIKTYNVDLCETELKNNGYCFLSRHAI